jgi:hypothetical protein
MPSTPGSAFPDPVTPSLNSGTTSLYKSLVGGEAARASFLGLEKPPLRSSPRTRGPRM